MGVWGVGLANVASRIIRDHRLPPFGRQKITWVRTVADLLESLCVVNTRLKRDAAIGSGDDCRIMCGGNGFEVGEGVHGLCGVLWVVDCGVVQFVGLAKSMPQVEADANSFFVFFRFS